MRLGVDAFNLAADRRGMGRFVHHMLHGLHSASGVDVFLIQRRAQDGALTPPDLPRARLDAVWYPWSGMRFTPHAPSIVTVHDLFPFTYPHRSFIARRREQVPIARAMRSADAIFAVSQWVAGEIARHFGIARERITVQPHTVDSFWHPVTVPNVKPYVLFVAGPEARKNAGFFFEVYDSAFGEAGPELVVAGTLNADDEAHFARMRASRRRVSPSDEELRALYSGALALAVPSLAEGFGLPVIEGMACGAPVIASDAAALPQAADGAALLLSPIDRQAWKAGLQRLARDEALREELRERGFARVARMDPAAPVNALLESLERLHAAAR